MKLTPRQISELSQLNIKDMTLWGGVPPEKADPDLSMYIHRGLVEWVGAGYRITDAGRAALDQDKGGGE